MSEPIQAIATNNYLLATQQEVSHDNTLSGNGTSASPLGVNETVLFDANGTSAVSAHLSESITAFEYAKFYLHDDGGTCWGCGELLSRDLTAGYNTVQCGFTTPWNTTGMRTIVAKCTDNTFQNWVTDGYQWWGNGGGTISTGYMIIQKVVGVNRISNN